MFSIATVVSLQVCVDANLSMVSIEQHGRAGEGRPDYPGVHRCQLLPRGRARHSLILDLVAFTGGIFISVGMGLVLIRAGLHCGAREILFFAPLYLVPL
jgi:hypothetical protein